MAKILSTLRSIILFERARRLVLKGKYDDSLKYLSSIDKIWNASSSQNVVLPAVNLLRIYALYKICNSEECLRFRDIIKWQINSKESKYNNLYNGDSKNYIESYLQIIMTDLGVELNAEKNVEDASIERKHYDINLVDTFLTRNFPILP